MLGQRGSESKPCLSSTAAQWCWRQQVHGRTVAACTVAAATATNGTWPHAACNGQYWHHSCSCGAGLAPELQLRAGTAAGGLTNRGHRRSGGAAAAGLAKPSATFPATPALAQCPQLSAPARQLAHLHTRPTHARPPEHRAAGVPRIPIKLSMGFTLKNSTAVPLQDLGRYAASAATRVQPYSRRELRAAAAGKGAGRWWRSRAPAAATATLAPPACAESGAKLLCTQWDGTLLLRG